MPHWKSHILNLPWKCLGCWFPSISQLRYINIDFPWGSMPSLSEICSFLWPLNWGSWWDPPATLSSGTAPHEPVFMLPEKGQKRYQKMAQINRSGSLHIVTELSYRDTQAIFHFLLQYTKWTAVLLHFIPILFKFHHTDLLFCLLCSQ